MQRATGKPLLQSVFLKPRIRQQENKRLFFYFSIFSQSQKLCLESALCLDMDGRSKNTSYAKEEKNKYNTWILEK